MNIINKKIENHELNNNFPEDVKEYIASNCVGDIRKLEGALTRVFAYATIMNGSDINLELAAEALKDYFVKTIVAKNNIEQVMHIVSSNYNVSIDDFEDTLKNKRAIDIKNTVTMTGPHRDDFGIYINDIDVRVYGSQGQQRTAALSLKLAEIELVKDIINDNPILLLDDVMSELDSRRRDALLDSIKDIQTIITCTGYDDFVKKRINVDKIYKIVKRK